MSTTPKKKGPAEVAASPSRGSNPAKDIKNMKEDSTAAVQRQVNWVHLSDELQKAKERIDCIFLAADGLGDSVKMNAIARVAVDASDMIMSVQEILEGSDSGEDRVVVNVGHVLSEMLCDHAEVTAALNRHEGDEEEANKLSTQQCEIALTIIGYRPLTKLDERRKAEFLRRWTADTSLTEEEQKALIASMLPEGGAA